MKFINRFLFRFFPDYSFSREISKSRMIYNSKINYSKDTLEKQNLYAEMKFEISILFDEWNVLKSDEIIRNAMKFFISIPLKPEPEKDNLQWTWSSFGHYLNQGTRQEIQKLILEEKRKQRDSLAFIIGAMTGLLGVTMGILSILVSNGIFK